MREIKFRAWSYEQKRMFDVSGIVDFQIYEKFNKSIHPKISCELLQYTGLKDKNGKEIYDGDILKWKCSKSGSDACKNRIVTIEYIRHGYDIVIHDNGERWGAKKSFWNPEDREIIGNIYENPDLLK